VSDRVIGMRRGEKSAIFDAAAPSGQASNNTVRAAKAKTLAMV
jgi:hypothetical protein